MGEKVPRDLCWVLYERMTFIESSTKAGWLPLSALWKQDDFRWELYESRTTFVESVNRYNTKFCDKIAYVGGPSFRRRPSFVSLKKTVFFRQFFGENPHFDLLWPNVDPPLIYIVGKLISFHHTTSHSVLPTYLHTYIPTCLPPLKNILNEQS